MKEKLLPEQIDLNNEDYVKKILESGTSEELEKLRGFHNLTPEQIELFSYYAKLRKGVHEEMKQELEERLDGDLEADQEELDMGAYRENIEPQVRETVLEMRRKGYTSYESGFSGENRQKISFEKEHLKDFEFPEELIRDFETQDIDIKIKPNSIMLAFGKQLNLDEIEDAWNKVVEVLPDLGEPAEPCNLKAAKSFRRKQI